MRNPSSPIKVSFVGIRRHVEALHCLDSFLATFITINVPIVLRCPLQNCYQLLRSDLSIGTNGGSASSAIWPPAANSYGSD